MKKRRAVITGMGIVAPNGTGIKEFGSSLRSSSSGITWIKELSDLNFNCQVGGLCKIENSSIKEKYQELNIPIISRSTLLLTESCLEALKDAGLSGKDNHLVKNADIIIGSVVGPADIWGEKVIDYVDKGKHLKLGSYAFEQIINSSPAAMLSGLLGTTGRVISNSLACASSTESIIEAANKIRFENKDIIIAGGVEAYSKYYWATMDAMRITCSNFNNEPEKASRPMSASARGFIPAEGSAVLIIEEYEHAKARNAHIYAEIAGSNVNCGGQRNGGSMTASNFEQLERCLSGAISDAGINPEAIDYISGHLTGTKADVSEIKAWKNLMPDGNLFPYINSVKSLIGHTLGACGAIEVIAIVIQMKENYIHGTSNCEDLNPEIENLISREKVPEEAVYNFRINYAAKANFGFGDVNACLILKNLNE